jgi:hypothetical protein
VLDCKGQIDGERRQRLSGATRPAA